MHKITSHYVMHKPDFIVTQEMNIRTSNQTTQETDNHTSSQTAQETNMQVIRQHRNWVR